jgi:hypothetical protein
MPLQNAIPARNDLYQDVQYIKKNLVFGDTGAKTVGVLPAGAIIVKSASGAYVQIVSNAGTTNVVDIGFTNGTTSDDDYYGTDLSTATVGFVPLDEVVPLRVAVDTTITATMGLVGTAATTGDVDIVIAYILPQ